MITEESIPRGNTTEERRQRQRAIMTFYQNWKRQNPEQKRFNIVLKEDINIRSVSIVETAAQASLTYLSTLAVLQLDAILTNAWLVRTVPSKPNSKNQRAFESMLIMEYICSGIGRVKMTVGVKRTDKQKVQYCITAIGTGKKNRRINSLLLDLPQDYVAELLLKRGPRGRGLLRDSITHPYHGFTVSLQRYEIKRRYEN